MARKVTTWTVEAEGRDKGKRFRLTEMSARRAEDWAVRAFLALARAGVEVPDDVEAAGFAGIAALGLQGLGGVRYADVKPLMDEMLECVEIVTDERKGVARPLFGDDDVEEPLTYMQLKREVLRLHVDFSEVAARLNSRRAATGPQDGSSRTETSPN